MKNKMEIIQKEAKQHFTYFKGTLYLLHSLSLCLYVSLCVCVCVCVCVVDASHRAQELSSTASVIPSARGKKEASERGSVREREREKDSERERDRKGWSRAETESE